MSKPPETPVAEPAASPAPAPTPSGEAAAPATIVTEPQKPAASAAEPKKEPEAAKPPEAKPLDLKLPEGSHLTAKDVEKVAARAKELNLTPEQAQAELQRESDLVKSFVDGEKQKLANEVAAWVNETKNDAEIGGEKFAVNAEMAKRVVNRFGTEAFKKALDESGLGNHPELVRVFVRIGKAMSDDQFIHPSSGVVEKKSAADVLYGDTSLTTKEK